MIKKAFRSVFAAFFIFSATSVFAELASPHRNFEIGFDAEAGLSNNYFRPKEILVKDVVIDLKKISQEMPGAGFILDYDVIAQGHLSIDAGKYFRLNFFYGLDGTGYGHISKNIFEMIGEGIEANTCQKVDLDVYADLFLSTGISVKTDIKGFGVRLTPALFAPVIHVANNEGLIKYTSTETGLIRAEADVPVDIYSLISLENIKDTKIDGNTIQDFLNQAVRSMGFDLTAEVEKQLTNTFDLGLFTRIPMVPGRLHYKASTRYYGIFEQTNLLGVLNETESSQKDYGHDDFTYTDASCNVHRPFVMGFEGAWRPFGNWCIFRPKLDLTVRNPFSSDYQTFCEWGLTADFVILKVIGLKFGTAYENLVFKQTMGFMVNTRIVEFNAAVQFRGADFANSFAMSGATAILSLKIGC